MSVYWHAQKSLIKALGLIAFAIFVAPSAVVFAQNSELDNIQSLIKEARQKLNENLRESERLQQELKLAELEIAETATLLNKTDTELALTSEEKSLLEKEREDTQTSIKEQQALLSKQIKSAYVAGNYDFAKMLFNQNDAGRFERVLTYYKYLNQARQSQIEQFENLIEVLKNVELDLSAKEQELEGLLSSQKSQSSLLREQQQSRHRKLKELDEAIESETAKVESLLQEEQALIAAIEQAELDAREREESRLHTGIELNGLSQFKGKLVRPAEGKLSALFGKRRQGQVRWKGVLFAGEEGEPVKVVQDGKVLYADWLRGFGLVTIVDHGQGYMTVYGRTQALLKEAGQIVMEGDTIGLVGSSGGQSSSGLYFELRHKGKALNPVNWLTN